MARTVLVTGATGQIGGALTRALQRAGDRVRCLVRDREHGRRLLGEEVELAAGDVTVPDSLPPALRGIEVVAHLAGKASYWPALGSQMRAVHVAGTANLLDACARAGVNKLLFTSSIATLGWVAGHGVGDETTAYNWHGLGIDYFDTKYAAERMVLAETRLATIAVNPGVVFGAGDRAVNGLRLLREIAGGVPGYPPGATTAAVLDDVVAGHVAALERGRPGQRYVLGGTPLTFAELFEAIAEVVGAPTPRRRLAPLLMRGLALASTAGGLLTGHEPRITLPAYHILTRNRRYSSAKAVAELGYPISPLAAGLRQCWEWHSGHGEPAAAADGDT